MVSGVRLFAKFRPGVCLVNPVAHPRMRGVPVGVCRIAGRRFNASDRSSGDKEREIAPKFEVIAMPLGDRQLVKHSRPKERKIECHQ